MILEQMSYAQAEEAFKKDPLMIIPVGSLEQHGPQCALGTDFIVPRYIAEKVAERVDNVIVGPTVQFGVCDYHMNFAGTVNIGFDGLYMLLNKITQSFMNFGVKRFMIINGHGQNTPAIDQAGLDVYRAGGVLAALDWWSIVGQVDPKYAGGHADKIETQAMMAVDPDGVHMDYYRPKDGQDPTDLLKAKAIQTVTFKGGVVKIPRATDEIAPNGWYGPVDPKDATVEEGQAMMKLMVDYASEFAVEFRKVKVGK